MVTDSTLTCPDCGRRFPVSGRLAGRDVECPHCGTAFRTRSLGPEDTQETGRVLKTRVMGDGDFDGKASVKRAFFSRGAGQNTRRLEDARPDTSLYRRSEPTALRLRQKDEPEPVDAPPAKTISSHAGVPWLRILRPWLPLSGVFILISVEFASVCMWTLPIIGRVPGPPSPVVQAIFACGHLVGCMAALFWAIPLLAEGTWLQRVTVSGACVLSAPVIYFAGKMVTATLASVIIP